MITIPRQNLLILAIILIVMGTVLLYAPIPDPLGNPIDYYNALQMSYRGDYKGA